jgi:hypothetical protein
MIDNTSGVEKWSTLFSVGLSKLVKNCVAKNLDNAQQQTLCKFDLFEPIFRKKERIHREPIFAQMIK